MNQIVREHGLAGSVPLGGRIDSEALDRLFRKARTQNGWQDRLVPHGLLEEAVDLAKMGPTAANASPMRILFVESEAGKARLKPALSPGNVDKTMSAPVTAIVGHDLAFYEHLPRLFPHMDLKPVFANDAAAASHMAFQNGTLQLAYFIMALRALGLDAGPMGGFDKDKVDAEFFAGTEVKSNVLVNIGYGDEAKLFPRSPRLEFEEIARYA